MRPAPSNGFLGDASGTGLEEGVGAGVLNADWNIVTQNSFRYHNSSRNRNFITTQTAYLVHGSLIKLAHGVLASASSDIVEV